MGEQTLETWLRRMVYVSRAEGDVCALKLKNINLEGQASAVADWPVSKTLDEERLNAIALEIESEAQRDAEGIGSLCRYGIYAYVRDNKTPVGRYVFRRGASEDIEEGSGGAAIEPATSKGVTAQMMRHTEAAMKHLITGSGQTTTMLQRQLARSLEYIEHLETKHIESVKLYEELLTERHLREAETTRLEYDLARKKEVFEKIMLLAPSVVNRIAGRRILPEQTTPETEMLDSFMQTLNESQLRQLSGILKPEQMVVVGQLYGQFQERAEKITQDKAAKDRPLQLVGEEKK